MSLTAAADGILRIAATAMSYAVKAVTPNAASMRRLVLVAYGGAGPLHAVQVAREIGIRKGHHPGRAGRYSRRRHACSRTCATIRCVPADAARRCTVDQIERIYGELEGEGRRAIANTSVTPQKVTIKRRPTCVTIGQEHARDRRSADAGVREPEPNRIKRHFDDMHLLRYGTSAPGETRRDRQPALDPHRRHGQATRKRSPAAGPRRSRPPSPASVRVFRRSRIIERGRFARAALLAGNRIRGRR